MESPHTTNVLWQSEQVGYGFRSHSAGVSYGTASQVEGFRHGYGTHHCERGIDDTYGESVDGVVEFGHFFSESVCRKSYLVIVNEEQEEMAARLDLFLPNEFVKLEFEFGVGDINYGELLSVILVGVLRIASKMRRMSSSLMFSRS